MLDPTDLTISDSLNSGGSFSDGVWVYNSTPAADTATVNIAALITALTSGSVTISTSSTGGSQGDITVSGAIDSLSGNSLTLIADNSITISNPIDLGGGLTLRADGTIDIFADITTASGLRITSGGSTTIASTVRNTNGVGNISIVSDGSIVINGILSTIGTTGSGGNIFLDADGGDITGVGAIVLENPANATGSSLGMQATGDIGVNVSMPLVGSLDPASAIWTPQLAGPPVAADAGGILFIRNLEISTFPNNGITGSAVVAGAANGLGGFRSGGAMTISGGTIS